MHLPSMISDLALVLIVAGITTVIFKKIRQPVVLGYIVAGFLTGPYFSFFPTVVDTESINIWSEIGVICLMFALGLEFSFKKLAKVGGAAVITALTEVCGLLLVGIAVGHLLGWDTMDSVILGGVLSMSSTTIIIKAFEELNLKGKKFTQVVFGGLIVEDIVGIFIMVMMSTFAMSKGAGGSEIFGTVVQLLFYLVLWLVLGIYIIPLVLKKTKDFMNSETLLIASLGICFGTVLLFSRLGFSTALGAFIAGSILAGTVVSEKIERLHKPIKDLFGAVFFVSVGMLVNPVMLYRYALPILVITAATILGKLIFSTMGVLLSGKKLSTAVSCGASLTQIGEFAFIIAGLGASLKLSSDFIYPIVVSVSVITTFTTPFFIKHADRICSAIKKCLPRRLCERLESREDEVQSNDAQGSQWKDFIVKYALNVLLLCVVSLGAYELGVRYIEPFLQSCVLPVWAGILTTMFVLGSMAPFLVALAHGRDKNSLALLTKSKTNYLPLFIFMLVRIAIAAALVVLSVHRFMSIPVMWLIVPALVLIFLLLRSDRVIGQSMQIRIGFLLNFNEKTLAEQAERIGSDNSDWVSNQLWVSSYRIGGDFQKSGIPLRKLRWKNVLGVNIIKIVSDRRHINIPDGNQVLNIGDIVCLCGAKPQIDAFELVISNNGPIGNMEPISPPVTLGEFLANQDTIPEGDRLFLYRARVDKNLRLSGKSIRKSGTRQKWHCDIAGIVREGLPIIYPASQFVLYKDDKIWFIGGCEARSQF